MNCMAILGSFKQNRREIKTDDVPQYRIICLCGRRDVQNSRCRSLRIPKISVIFCLDEEIPVRPGASHMDGYT